MSQGTAQTGDQIFTNARIILPDEVITGSVHVEKGLIASIDPGTSAVPGALDCGGDYLAPGLIELHTDNLERHMQPRPGVVWPADAAILAHDGELAATGITTVFDALRVGSVVSNRRSRHGRYGRRISREILALRASGSLRISHFLHLRAEMCSETLIEELAEFGPDDRIGILSLMDHTPGQRQFADLAQFRVYLAGKFQMSDALIDEHIAFQSALGARMAGPHREAAVAHAALLDAVLASHDDTDTAHVAQSQAAGVTLAEFPTTIEAARACREAGMAVLMGGPNIVQGGSHSGNVSAVALAEAGLLDILSSDYVPSSLLGAALMLGQRGDALPSAMAMVTSAPAAAARLHDRGRIAIGLRADLLRFDLAGTTPVPRGVWVQGRRIA